MCTYKLCDVKLCVEYLTRVCDVSGSFSLRRKCEESAGWERQSWLEVGVVQ